MRLEDLSQEERDALDPAQLEELIRDAEDRGVRLRPESQTQSQAEQQSSGGGLGGLVGAGLLANNLFGGGSAESASAMPAVEAAFESTAPVASAVTESGAPGLLLGTGEVVPATGLGGLSIGDPSLGGLLAGQSPIANVAAGNLGAGSVLGTLGGAIGAYNLVDNFGNRDPLGGAASGAAVGTSILPGIGTAIGAAVGGLIGAIKKGKHADQIQRDNLRGSLEQAGFLETIDGSHHVTLGDGSKFNVGLDGNAKFTGADGQTQIANGFEVDHTNPLAPQVIAWLEPLGRMVGGENDKVGGDFITQMANAAMSNAGGDVEVARENVRKMYRDLGFRTTNQVKQGVSASGMSPDEIQRFNNQLDQMIKVAPDAALPGSENQINLSNDLLSAFNKQNRIETPAEPDAELPDEATPTPDPGALTSPVGEQALPVEPEITGQVIPRADPVEALQSAQEASQSLVRPEPEQAAPVLAQRSEQIQRNLATSPLLNNPVLSRVGGLANA